MVKWIYYWWRIFTSYFNIYPKLKWGLQLNLEFGITQNLGDLILLEVINEFFDMKGNVYKKSNNMGIVLFRNIKPLINNIISFFDEYHLLSSKSYDYEKWIKITIIYHNKEHFVNNFELKQEISLFN